MDQFASFLVLVLFLILVGLIVFYVIPERARYQRMKVRAYESLVYAECLARHFSVSNDTVLRIIISKEDDPVLGKDYAKLDKALDLFVSICRANNITDPYAEIERIEEEECSQYDDYPV